MWTSNNSTTLMMLPIGMAILHREKAMGADISRFAPALMLCIAYSASIGGTGTLIGTPPNLLFVSTVEEMFPDAPESFVLAMYHNIKGKQYLWRDKDMNDNSILSSE